MSDRLRGWVLKGVVLAGLATLLALGWQGRERFAPLDEGGPAPAYAAASLDGDTVTLASLRGRVVLLNVWATWCPPCRWEMPAMERVHRALRDEGLEVVAVSVDAAPGRVDLLGRAGGDVRAMVEELGLSFTVLHDPEGRIQRRFGVTGLPTTFLIGRDGRIAGKVLGPAEWDRPPHIDRIRALLEG